MRPMSGGVIEVHRRERAGLSAWLDVVSVLRALRVARRRARRPAADRGAAALGGDAADASGRIPLLVAEADGRPRCVACGLCAFACPTGCLTVVPGAHPHDVASRRPARFELDLPRCIACGLCEDACPEVALVMGPVAHCREAVHGRTRLDLPALLVPAARLAPALEAIRHADDAVPAGGQP